MNLSIITENYCKELSYAVVELKKFLNIYTSVHLTEEDGAGAQIRLCVDETMKPHCYTLDGDGAVLKIRGGNISSVLCGVYEALADAGILFEANGHSLPGKFDLEGFLGSKKEISPKCRFRGIRQHINFTMDISSYALKDAKEYIRSLARMRYNAMTFHSYGGQWHVRKPGESGEYAGHFFYGQTHPVPTCDPITTDRIQNRKIFCIPEVEAIYEDEAARGEYAQYWLGEVMSTAKETGMEVTLSVELACDDEAGICAMLHEVCKTYPMIDNIELISFENFGETDPAMIEKLTRENMNRVAAEILGEDVLDAAGNLEGIGEDYSEYQRGALYGGIVYFKRIRTALAAKEKWMEGLTHRPQIRAGLYVCNKDVLKVLCPLMKKVIPADIKRCLLPAHGSLFVANNIEYCGAAEDGGWQNIMFYSWAEFDGNMYIQQQASDGIEKLLYMPEDESIYGFCINHWRTAENSMAISYAAEAAVKPIRAVDFYKAYAKKTGMTEADKFAAAFDRMAKLDVFCRNDLFNIGFCAVGCWLSWYQINGKACPRGFSVEALEYAIAEYEAIKAEFEQILPYASAKESIAPIRLMINRCTTSILFLRSVLVLEDLHKVYDYQKLETPTEEQCEEAMKIINKSRQYAMDYVLTYGELMPDRGAEGQIASFCETALVYIDAVAAVFAGNDSQGGSLEFFDLPPMPSEEGSK